MTEDQIKYMVNRFLSWRLPADFSPDAGIKYTPVDYGYPETNEANRPVGTNLLSADQAEAMVRYMIDGLPKWTADRATCKHRNRKGSGSAGSDGSSSFSGYCADCGLDLSYRIEGSRLGAELDLSMQPHN